eukprot:7376293-Prymnesium_polylepis.1
MQFETATGASLALPVPRLRRIYRANAAARRLGGSSILASLADKLWAGCVSALESSGDADALARTLRLGAVVRAAGCSIPGTSHCGWTSGRLALYGEMQSMGRHTDKGNCPSVYGAGVSVALGNDSSSGGTVFYTEEDEEAVHVPSGKLIASDYLVPHSVKSAGEGGRVAFLAWFETWSVAAAVLQSNGAPEVPSSDVKSGFASIHVAKSIVEAVSYTHLTLPTICSV